MKYPYSKIRGKIAHWSLAIGHRTSDVGHCKRAFTLAELIIATTVLTLILAFSAAIYNSFFGTVQNLKAANLVYDESRFVMERMANEIRNGTIDYEEYFNQAANFYGFGSNETLGKNYCEYSRQFYTAGPDLQFGTADDVSTGVRNPDSPPALSTPFQNQLFLINVNGDERTYIRRIVTKDDSGDTIGKIGMLKLIGRDYGIDHIPATTTGCVLDPGEKDGRIDTWECAPGFPCIKKPITGSGTGCAGTEDVVVYDPNGILEHPNDPTYNSFVDITPAALDVVDLQFIITPQDDPHKAYNTVADQIQPYVTIKLVAKGNPRISARLTGNSPNIVLDSTVSARSYNPVITECNIKECIPDPDPTKAQKKDCPKTEGVCAGALQTCQNFVWPGCSATDYLKVSADYEDGSEFRSCDLALTTCLSNAGNNKDSITACNTIASTCKNQRCSDGLDNDCNGLTDAQDPVCKQYLCNNGVWDAATNEVVKNGYHCRDVGDVGSACYYIHPLQEKETDCFDGLDNDCNGKADEFDPNCQALICSNGTLDPPKDPVTGDRLPPFFVSTDFYNAHKDTGIGYFVRDDTTTSKDSFLNEACIDIGGICGTRDASVANPKLSTETDLILGKRPGETDTDAKQRLCSDRLDNDCNGTADELDPVCQAVICTNGKQDCELVPKDYTPADYLKNYSNPIVRDLCLTSHVPGNTDNEYATDVGGLCQGFVDTKGVDHSLLPAENTKAACTDGLDNNANGKIDSADPSCCPDTDADGFLPSGIYDPFGLCVLPKNNLIDCNDLNSLIKPDDPTGFNPQSPRNNIEVCNDLTYPTCITEPCTFPGDFAQANLRETQYPKTLVGTPIDDNCSGANGGTTPWTTDGWDHNDPACCVDMDNDHYGIPDAYLYRAIEQGNPVGCYGGVTPQPDCDDSSPIAASVNPGAPENTPALCNDAYTNGNPVNNNCSYTEIEDPMHPGQIPQKKITVPTANHIDWYRDKDAAWFATYLNIAGLPGAGGIAEAKALSLFEPNCCNTAAPEICDDLTYGITGSDENCNGLEGYNDYWCLGKDGKSFFDNFTAPPGATHPMYVMAPGSGDDVVDKDIAFDTTAGTISLSMATDVDQTVTSETISPLNPGQCTNGYTVTLNPDPNPNTPEADSIKYQVSDDGGTKWCGLVGPCCQDAGGGCLDGGGHKWVTYLLPGASYTFNTPTVKQLRWRAALNGDGANKPVLKSLKLTISCL